MSSKVKEMDGVSPLSGLPAGAAEPTLTAVPSTLPAQATPLERRLHSENHDLSEDIMNERLRVAELERRLYEMDQERGYLRAMVIGARERNEIAYAEQSRAVAAAKAELATRIEAIRTSTSWRLTGPMRVMVRAVRRVLR